MTAVTVEDVVAAALTLLKGADGPRRNDQKSFLHNSILSHSREYPDNLKVTRGHKCGNPGNK